MVQINKRGVTGAKTLTQEASGAASVHNGNMYFVHTHRRAICILYTHIEGTFVHTLALLHKGHMYSKHMRTICDLYTHTYMHVFVCGVCICKGVYMIAYISRIRTYLWAFPCMSVYLCVYVHMCTCMCMCVCVYDDVHIYIYIYIYLCIYGNVYILYMCTYIEIYVYMYIHRYIHIYICNMPSVCCRGVCLVLYWVAVGCRVCCITSVAVCVASRVAVSCVLSCIGLQWVAVCCITPLYKHVTWHTHVSNAHLFVWQQSASGIWHTHISFVTHLCGWQTGSGRATPWNHALVSHLWEYDTHASHSWLICVAGRRAADEPLHESTHYHLICWHDTRTSYLRLIGVAANGKRLHSSFVTHLCARQTASRRATRRNCAFHLRRNTRPLR